MGTIFAYSLTSALLLATMYLVFKWMLAGENQHRYNRAILWLIYTLSLTLPALIPALKHLTETASHQTGITGIEQAIEIGMPSASIAEAEPLLLPRILLAIYIAGAAAAAVYTVFVAIKLHATISKGEKMPHGRYTLAITPDTRIAPFSWCCYIVMSRSDFETSGEVITLHETRHLDARHWVDLLLAQLVAIFQWYNPAAWLMREELKTVHEFQADEAVIRSGTDPRQYQMLLIKKAVGARFPSLANSLNHSKLKKRITMMYNQKTSRRRALRPLLLLPALGAAFWISQLPAVASALSTVSSAELPSAVSADKVSENPSDKQVTVTTLPPTSGRVMNVTTVSSGGAATAAAVPTQSVATDQKAATTDGAEEKEVSTAVEQMPEFPGGTRALMEYVVANLQHPKGTENISGRVVLKFVVEKDGSIGDVQVIRSLDPRLDAEAIRVVKSFPKWTPGIKDGKNVAVWYAIPITFRAMGDDTKDAKAAGDDSSSTSVSTSVSTMTDDSGKTSSSTYTSVHVKENGETIHFLLSPDGLPDNVAYYVNGERFDGNLKDIPASDIESMTIDKSNPGETAIRINLKNK